MLHWRQIWTHMRKLTKREIEKRAVMEIINHFEPQIDAVIKQSVVELERINDLKEIQGLHQKVRIDQDCIKKAIKTINSNDDVDSPKKGGRYQKIGEKNVLHTPKERIRGVEIT